MNERSPFSLLPINLRVRVRRIGLLCLSAFMLMTAGGKLGAQDANKDFAQSEMWKRSHALMLENMGFYLDGAVAVDMDTGRVQWKTSETAVFRRLERIVQEVAGLQSLPAPWIKGGFSDEIKELIEQVSSLDHRDLRRWRMAENLSEEEEWYVLVQSGLDELKMQLAMELNYRVNAALFESLKGLLTENSGVQGDDPVLDWLTLDANTPLPSMALELSSASSGAISAEDRSVWPGNDAQDLTYWMERILYLLEGQERRIISLESSGVMPIATSVLLPISTDATLSQLRLPEAVNIPFSSASASMDLNAQLQLNEVMELLCRHPQIRVVCTGHADPSGARSLNHTLSKSRAQTVRNYILQSGLESHRVLLNYFGEERNSTHFSFDRRVEIRFYVE